jgi:nitronate monooxygenase
MTGFPRLQLDKLKEPLVLQGWFPPQAEILAAGFAEAGVLGVLRVPAFPDITHLEARLEALATVKGRIGLDLKGLLGRFEEVMEVAKSKGVSFLVHGTQLKENFKKKLDECELPRLARVENLEEALLAYREGAHALIVAGKASLRHKLAEIRAHMPLPLIPEASHDAADAADLLTQPGVAGLQIRSPQTLREGVQEGVQGFPKFLPDFLHRVLEDTLPALPPLKIRDFEVPYPIFQGGMGVGVSWERLAGASAAAGIVGLVSAIGTGYRHPEMIQMAHGRPVGPENINNGPALRRIMGDAIERAGAHGIVGVNILCAINGYEQVVRDAIAAGTRVVVSGAGLPMALPDYAANSNAALIPIVSSDRALKLICKSWQRKFNRLPDAVVLEGPESGGHQGFSVEQCTDPAYSLEALLGPVLEERDRWGSFPVIAAGGVWDRADITRFMAAGAGGVQIATRFIGTFECDASLAFKTTVLQAGKEDIALVKSPVGMPGRAVQTELQRHILRGDAPAVRCISDCVAPCGKGEGARRVGYCIADRLDDARIGNTDTGLFFSGSNGWRLEDYLPVQELVEELTGDYGLQRVTT